jgi:hypothetical protein
MDSDNVIVVGIQSRGSRDSRGKQRIREAHEWKIVLVN